VAAFGEELRRAREERGVAVETVCAATKVSPKHIRALEAGEIGELPGGVFRRGFVRSYLRALDLEEDTWMRRFEETCRQSGMHDPAEMEWVTFAENVKNNRSTPRRGMGIRSAAIVLLLTMVGLAAWCGWRLTTHRRLIPLHMATLSSKTNSSSL
jgi:cytoskeleton protein RodZ